MTKGDGPASVAAAKRLRIAELIDANRLDEAMTLLRQMCLDEPTDAWPWFLLGTLHGQRRAFDECIHCLRKSISIDAQNPDAHYNLAQAFMHIGQWKEAIAEYRFALHLKPDDATIWNNAGYALARTGGFAEAAKCHERALLLRPGDAEALNNLGGALAGAGRAREAVMRYRAAIALRPDYLGAHANLARALRMMGELTAASTHCDGVLRAHPSAAGLLCERGMSLQLQGLAREADADFSRAAELSAATEPGWTGRLFNMNYFCDDPVRIFRAHRDWGEKIAGDAIASLPHANEPGPGRRLRVGYVSRDLFSHPVALFLEPLLASHDRDSFETFCYASAASPDAVTQRLQRNAAQWRDIAGLAPAAVADTVRADSIDILVDLAGLTDANLWRVFALKPAPIQVSWLGYPNTTGIRTIDYRLTDVWADPPGEADRLHTEQLVRLPAGFLCFRPPRFAPPVVPSPSDRVGYVTFGAFNNLAKVTPGVIAAWIRILSAVPESRLLVKNHGFRDGPTAARFRRVFAEAGIVPERIMLREWTASITDHLDMYSLVDIGLDTFPYNGTTTTCEALWMGVPVVCLAGNRHAGRVGVSILSGIGLTELIGANPSEYVTAAIGLAQDAGCRAALRRSLRARVAESPLCNETGFARNIEAAFREMWQRWINGQAGQGTARP